MAEKKVSIEFPALPLGKVDLVFKVKSGSEVFGDLKVSKGGIEWRPKFGRHVNGKTVVKKSWTQLANLLDEERR